MAVEQHKGRPSAAMAYAEHDIAHVDKSMLEAFEHSAKGN